MLSSFLNRNLRWWASSILLACVFTYCIYSIRDSNTKNRDLNTKNIDLNTMIKELQTPLREGELPPCGEVCSYNGSVVPTATPTQIPQLHKHINCRNIMGRMAYSKHTIVYPPPRNPPKELYDAFTQFGDSPITKDYYIVGFSKVISNDIRNINKKAMQNLIDEVNAGGDPNQYNDSGCAKNTLKKYRPQIEGLSSVVIGTQIPWMESMLITNGAGHVTTLEYSPLVLDHPTLSVYNPYKYAKMYLAGNSTMFDFGGTYSSLEHSGLGRYGDPINPYGDFEAMAQVWCMMKPGGVFMVGLPGTVDGPSYIEWNAHRVYGSKRLQHIASNWIVLETIQCSGHQPHVILILQKPK